MDEHPAWLIFFGTHTTIVRAAGRDSAFCSFVGILEAGLVPGFGRLAPPSLEEVMIRRPTEKDRGWIENSRDPQFIALLPDLVPA